MTADIRQTLMAVAILRDSFDEFCSLSENMLAVTTDSIQKIERLDILELTNQDAVQQILESLPPKNASALLAAIISIGELSSPTSPNDVEMAIRAMQEGLAQLQHIRDNLHTALDGVV